MRPMLGGEVEKRQPRFAVLEKAGARPQNFGERIIDFAFWPEGDNSILGQGVTLLREVRAGLVTNPVTPPSSHRQPLSGIALHGCRRGRKRASPRRARRRSASARRIIAQSSEAELGTTNRP